MKSLIRTAYCSVLATVAASVPVWGLENDGRDVIEVECKYAVQLLHLQDTTATFADYKDEMVSQMSKLIGLLSVKYEESRFAYSAFSDKPLLGMGYGYVDSCGADFIWDKCYETLVPMTNVTETVLEAIRRTSISGGKDFREAQLEGLIRAAQDPSVGWESIANDVEAIKILVLVTDDEHHSAGDAQYEVEDWRENFGMSADWCGYQMAQAHCVDLCVRAGELRVLVDVGSATFDEVEEYHDIQRIIGPANPADMLPHPAFGVFGNDNCSTHDYPTIAQVAEVVNANNVKVVVLHAGDHGEQQYRDLVTHFDSGLFMKMSDDASNVAALIDNAVAEILAKQCYQDASSSSPAPTPPVAPTTVAGSFRPITVPGYQDASSSSPTPTPPVAPTTVAGSFQPVTVPGYHRPTAPGNEPSTLPASSAPHTASDGAESSGGVAAGPPPPSGGISTGVIIGSAAGGAAAVLAAAAWFTGGFGMVGGASSTAALAATNVEVPEVSIDREVAEAVAMDMFA